VFQVRVSRDPVPDAGDDAVAVTIGADRGPHAIPGLGRPASTDAFAIARARGVGVDPIRSSPLAGVVAAGSVPGTDGSGDALEAAEHTDRVRRRPGVALPTVDLADGLAASMLVRTSYSGDSEAARAALADLGLPADLDDDAHRRLASLVAVVDGGRRGCEHTGRLCGRRARSARTPRSETRHRSRRSAATPTCSTRSPARLPVRESRWRSTAIRATSFGPPRSTRGGRTDSPRTARALDDATIGRYDGCLVARVALAGGDRSEEDGDAAPDAAAVLPTVARLVRDFRSPEPVAVAVDEAAGRLAAAATGGGPRSGGATAEPIGLGDACRSAASEGRATAGDRRPAGSQSSAPPPTRRTGLRSAKRPTATSRARSPRSQGRRYERRIRSERGVQPDGDRPDDPRRRRPRRRRALPTRPIR